MDEPLLAGATEQTIVQLEREGAVS